MFSVDIWRVGVGCRKMTVTKGQKADDVQNNVSVMDQSATLGNLLNTEIFEMTQHNLVSS
jgi:hypothetical protein